MHRATLGWFRFQQASSVRGFLLLRLIAVVGLLFGAQGVSMFVTQRQNIDCATDVTRQRSY
jgi:hypothetical protein